MMITDTMPSNMAETMVELCWVAGDAQPFVCGAIGNVCVDMLSAIEVDCEAEPDVFEHGDGVYLFRVTKQEATYHNGGLVDREYWELECVGFEPLTEPAT